MKKTIPPSEISRERLGEESRQRSLFLREEGEKSPQSGATSAVRFLGRRAEKIKAAPIASISRDLEARCARDRSDDSFPRSSAHLGASL